ncbi:MBL fold metallo-hydrolase, partial [Streptomyces sp. NPDC059017]|uniref:MBL fold metallo-hydrolase n=1 Tax=Streptomyces sp. NPDC059017 TaxID=3346700 RepID=UPI00367E6385
MDPPRDVDQVLAAAARRGVRISHVVETHIHNDYLTGGPELARLTGAVYLVPAGARVSFTRTPVVARAPPPPPAARGGGGGGPAPAPPPPPPHAPRAV